MRFLSALGDIGEKMGVGTNSRDVCFFCCASGKGGSGSICDNSWPLQNQQNSWLPAQSCGTNAVDWIITLYSRVNWFSSVAPTTWSSIWAATRNHSAMLRNSCRASTPCHRTKSSFSGYSGRSKKCSPGWRKTNYPRTFCDEWLHTRELNKPNCVTNSLQMMPQKIRGDGTMKLFLLLLLN